MKENLQKIEFRVNREKESDILGWIEDRKKDGSLAGAIKGLIRRDIQERKKQ